MSEIAESLSQKNIEIQNLNRNRIEKYEKLIYEKDKEVAFLKDELEKFYFTRKSQLINEAVKKDQIIEILKKEVIAIQKEKNEQNESFRQIQFKNDKEFKETMSKMRIEEQCLKDKLKTQSKELINVRMQYESSLMFK